jgi:hypothetical protein
MIRRLILAVVTACLAASFVTVTPVIAAHQHKHVHHHKPKHPFPVNFRGTFHAKVVYFKYFAGMEPDFDILSRVVVEGKVHSKGSPPMTLILDAYIENFQQETQPVLPDLIEPNRSLHYQLGGFFSGDAVILGAEKSILYKGALYIEALIPNSCRIARCAKSTPEPNHMLLYQVDGQGDAKGSYFNLRGKFDLYSNFAIKGTLWGQTKATPSSTHAIAESPGRITGKEALKLIHVASPPQRGTGGTGKSSRGFCLHLNGRRHCTGAGVGVCPKHLKAAKCPGSDPGTTSWLPAPLQSIAMPLGIALIVLAMLLLVVFFVQERAHRSSATQVTPPS